MSPELDQKNPQPAAAAISGDQSQPELHPDASGAATAAAAAFSPAPPVPPEPSADSTAPEGAEAVEAEQSREGMNQLFDQYATPQPATGEGEFLEGRVLAINDLGVVVDVGGKSEGLIPRAELEEAGIEIDFKAGHTIPVQLLHERKEGYQLLSHVRARRRKVWEDIEKSHRENLVLNGKVVDRIKGGLVVDIGIRAFLPASQVDIRPVHELDIWKGQTVPVRVLKVNRKRGNVVVSRRVLLEEEQKAKREALMATLSEGAVLQGRVKNITEYGVFVDLGGLDGLLHVTDLSWGRVAHPSDAVSVGQQIEVKVLKFDREKMRVSLGRKQLLPDPWSGVVERYPVGARRTGKVVGVTDYGAFVELEPGIEGLVHVSEMSWSRRLKHPSKIVQVGNPLEIVILDIKPDLRRISLGLKQTLPDPWEGVAGKYPIGAIVTGRVRNLTDFGAFVEIEEGVDGLVHVSDISWTERIKHPGEKLKKGETLTAKVLKFDQEHRRLSLGLKQVNDVWAGWFRDHKVSQLVRGKVARNTSFGAFVELAEGIEGLCHISEIEDRRSRADREKQPRGEKQGGTTLEPGREYDFVIVKLEPDHHKIGLSYRSAVRQVEKRDMETYRSSKSSPTATIGDMIIAKRESS